MGKGDVDVLILINDKSKPILFSSLTMIREREAELPHNSRDCKVSFGLTARIIPETTYGVIRSDQGNGTKN